MGFVDLPRLLALVERTNELVHRGREAARRAVLARVRAAAGALLADCQAILGGVFAPARPGGRPS